MLMIGRQLTAEQRLNKATVAIMGRVYALSGVMMVGERTVEDGVPTAYTNGRDERYGREFVEELNDAELRFLIMHEVYHKLYKHLTTWLDLYKQDGNVANQACDYVINLKLVDEFGTIKMDDGTPFIQMPKCGLLDDRFRGMNAKQVYDILKKENEDDDGGGKGQGEGNGKGKAGAGGGMDDHGWEDAQALSDEEKKELERDIDEALRQGALVAGKTGSGGLRDMADLLQPKIDWREVLREFITTTCQGKDYSTWRRPNRRFVASNIYMPSSVSEQIDEIVIAIDTSGSIGGRELSQFLGEISGICEQVKPHRVRILYWDTKVCADEKYDGEEVTNIVKSTKPAGGGGTDVNCVTTYMQKESIKAQAVVVLTDGYLGGSWGKWDVPVLWCILGNKSASPSVGKAVHVSFD